jgi:purine nucleosidase
MVRYVLFASMLVLAASSWGARKVVVVTDCGNWVDDQLAIMELLASPQIDIRGIVATHYGAPGTNKQAQESAKSVLKSLGASNIPVWLGADGPHPAEISEGAKKLVELGEAGDLYVLCIATATDVASAIQASPKAAGNFWVYWVGGGPLPGGGRGDFNLANDLGAARTLMSSSAKLTWIPAAGVADGLKLSGPDLKKRYGAYGKAGAMIGQLSETIGTQPASLWDLAAAVLFVRAGSGYAKTQPAPTINDDYQLVPNPNGKSVVVYTGLITEKILTEFDKSLKLMAQPRP